MATHALRCAPARRPRLSDFDFNDGLPRELLALPRWIAYQCDCHEGVSQVVDALGVPDVYGVTRSRILQRSLRDAHRAGFAGLALLPQAEDGILIVTLPDCVISPSVGCNDPSLTPRAESILALAPDTYTEFIPDRRGVQMIVRVAAGQAWPEAQTVAPGVIVTSHARVVPITGRYLPVRGSARLVTLDPQALWRLLNQESSTL